MNFLMLIFQNIFAHILCPYVYRCTKPPTPEHLPPYLKEAPHIFA